MQKGGFGLEADLVQEVDVPTVPSDGGLVARTAWGEFDAEDGAVGGEDVVGEEVGDGETAEGAVGGHFGGFEHAGALGLDGISTCANEIKGEGGDLKYSDCVV